MIKILLEIKENVDSGREVHVRTFTSSDLETPPDNELSAASIYLTNLWDTNNKLASLMTSLEFNAGHRTSMMNLRTSLSRMDTYEQFVPKFRAFTKPSEKEPAYFAATQDSELRQYILTRLREIEVGISIEKTDMISTASEQLGRALAQLVLRLENKQKKGKGE